MFLLCALCGRAALLTLDIMEASSPVLTGWAVV